MTAFDATRRAALLGAGATLAACAAPAPLVGPPARGENPFALGVASGEPAPDGFVIWTRLVRDPLAVAGGFEGVPAEDVAWDVARDKDFRDVVRQGTFRARGEDALSVHVELAGLEPARDYWYRFRARGQASQAGRARTAPAPGTLPARLRFAVCGCNHYEHGFFAAYRHLADEAPDFAFHYGDYIYESGAYRGTEPRARLHAGGVCRTLDDYRRRYAQYKSDPDLQAAHAATPFIMSFDDHEVANNWSATRSNASGETPEAFLARRNAALRAWYEHMPLRLSQKPSGQGVRMFRSLPFGDLAAMHVLDTRQYRTRQPCGDTIKPACDGMLAADAQIVGPAQERWLHERLADGRVRWNFIAQQVAMMRLDMGERTFNMDSWAGYVAQRDRLHAFLQRRRPANPVVLTGDWHKNWVGHLKADYDDPSSPVLAPEFLSTSISSDGDSLPSATTVRRHLSDNPHVRHYSGTRGYMAFALTPGRLEATLRAVGPVVRADASVRTLARFAVAAGDPNLHDA